VDGKPTPTLEEFIAVVKEKKENVRVKSLSLDGQERMTTIPLNSEFWKTYSVKFDLTSGEWVRTENSL